VLCLCDERRLGRQSQPDNNQPILQTEALILWLRPNTTSINVGPRAGYPALVEARQLGKRTPRQGRSARCTARRSISRVAGATPPGMNSNAGITNTGSTSSTVSSGNWPIRLARRCGRPMASSLSKASMWERMSRTCDDYSS
jgi:hypothetical protein